MLYQIVAFLLDVATGLLGGACLLRLYMQYQRVSFSNPVGRVVFALTDWLVLPLRRVIPPVGRWDLSSLVGAFLLKLVQFGILLLLAGSVIMVLPFIWMLAGSAMGFVLLPVLAAFGTLQLAISAMTALMIVYAVLSWVQPGSPLYDVIDRLCSPLLRPLRRAIPLVGGVDLSPLALLVLLQVAAIILGHLQASLLR